MSSSTPLRIVIVGGGIAGLAAAIALRCPNRQITILEQSRLCSEIGATISLQPNATRILQQDWGMSDLLEDANGTVDCGFRVFSADGTLVNEIPLLARKQYGADRIIWHRQDLHSHLMKTAMDPSREGPVPVVRTASRVVGCDCDTGTVTLRDGETVEADIIIGADGIHSTIRSLLLGKEIKPKPTGSSCYRLMMSSQALKQAAPAFAAHINPQDPYTSMIMAHDCRLIMGPARDGKLYSVVALVPDEKMHEVPDAAQSWVTEGDPQKMLETFKDFPSWAKEMLNQAESVGLWQLRDIDPLDTWVRGRAILIGDAAHAMLPTQGQGASQTIEDAEALGAYFHDIEERIVGAEVTNRLNMVFEARHERASLIQRFSREAAKPATEKGSNEIKMRPDQFMDYNCQYRGAVDWQKQRAIDATLEMEMLVKGGKEPIKPVNVVQPQSASQQSAQPLKDSLETITGNVESNQLTAGTEPRDVDCFDSVDPFSSDFVPNVDDVFNGAYFAPIADTEEIRAPESSGIRNHGDEDARRRHIAFQRSPWLWNPERNQHAFSDYDTVSLDEQNVSLTSSPHMPHASNVVVPDRLSQAARDRIFQLVSKTAPPQMSFSSFPVTDSLDKLIKVGISKRAETDAWIHPYTFQSETSRPEFLTALVAAGCICFGIPSVNKTGLLLQEITRMSLNDLIEKDDSVTRDLQYLQGSMLWLEIGAFCGFKRKMIVAESNLQALITALRRAGRFDNYPSPSTTPTVADGENELNRKWRLWVEDQAYRRSLWLAPTAEAWRKELIRTGYDDATRSLRDILQDESTIMCIPASIDMSVALSGYLHGLAAQIWDHSQQARLLSSSTDPSSQLWTQTRQEKLYQSLRNLTTLLTPAPAVTSLFHEFLQMYLHVNLDMIARFAGKCGEEEAHHAYAQLQSWMRVREARIAVSHAGQIVRAGRAVPPYQVRGPDSMMIYHAIMVLWTYSMLIWDHANKTRPGTPMQESDSDGQLVYLDDDPSQHRPALNAFLFAGQVHPSKLPYAICAALQE
ncbi:fad binding domain containing protein [Stemphylium lycopersici]|uniref:Fad binding domain containing protein n=1 Tax=Stemphylium lycopersici TaxID=183478 RepID=A0A364MXU1_STELY|nr:fad binding domain containing protein [Stemphylium lycopersici]RAR06051.1 fad binding domain containing protein [Stemphylium lycopersici]